MMLVRTLVRGWIWGLLLGLGAAGGGALAQQQEQRAPAETVGAELRLLGSRAGVVFVGRVEKIEPKGGTGGMTGGGIVEITFSVEQPVLGVVGGSYVMREWAGRWTGGQQHFQVGQRAMFFLHAPSAAGMSSAVEGMMGVVPVVPMGANGEALLDVRWLATRVRRAQGAPLSGTAETAWIAQGGISLADGVAVTKAWQTNSVAEPRSVRLPEEANPAQPQGVRVGQSVGGVLGNEADDAPR
jgi:hypothetical protein